MGEWGMRDVPVTHLICVQQEHLGKDRGPVETEYSQISPLEAVFSLSFYN